MTIHLHRVVVGSSQAERTIRLVKRAPQSVYRDELIEHCEGMLQGKHLVPPEIKSGDMATVIAYWEGTWRESILSKGAGHASA